jgi:hypothetical protein
MSACEPAARALPLIALGEFDSFPFEREIL